MGSRVMMTPTLLSRPVAHLTSDITPLLLHSPRNSRTNSNRLQLRSSLAQRVPATLGVMARMYRAGLLDRLASARPHDQGARVRHPRRLRLDECDQKPPKRGCERRRMQHHFTPSLPPLGGFHIFLEGGARHHAEPRGSYERRPLTACGRR